MNAVKEAHFELAGAPSAGFPHTLILGTSYVAPEPKAALIICHGFKGFKDWGFFPYLARSVAEEGFAVVTFNFAHSGIGSDLLDFTELDRFRANTFSLEVQDLRLVVAAVRRGDVPSVSRSLALGLVGHSRGGAATLAVAAEDSDIMGAATLASICEMVEVTPEDEKRWREEGVVYVENARTGQQMPLGVELLDDMRAHRGLIESSAKTLKRPLLIVHGTADLSVPAACAERLHAWAPHSELVLLNGADHTFGARHPFSGATPDLERVRAELTRFFGSLS